MTAPAIENIPFLKEDTVNQVRWITLNRPKQRNPLSSLMLEALSKALAEAGNDPQVRATGALEPVDHPTAGTFDTVAAPFRMRTATSRVRGPAPEIGQHTDEVLAELD